MSRPPRPRRWWPRLLVLLVLAGGALAGIWYLEPAWRPAWLPFDLPRAPSATATLYRWQDASGQWVISDVPPPAGTAYEEVTVRHDTNVLPSIVPDD